MIKNASAHATEEERVDALVSLSLSVPISILLYLSLITLDDGGSGLWLAAGCGAVVVTPHTESSMARQGSAASMAASRSFVVGRTYCSPVKNSCSCVPGFLSRIKDFY